MSDEDQPPAVPNGSSSNSNGRMNTDLELNHRHHHHDPHLHVMPANAAKVIKGEIHNVLNVMRSDARYASPLRFSEELPLDEHPLLQALRELHDTLSHWEYEDRPMDVVAYLTPFCSAISGRDISATVTGAALSSIHKFLLYGFITQDTTPHAAEGMTLVAKSLLHCTFEESTHGPASSAATKGRLNVSLHSNNTSSHGGSSSSSSATWHDDEQVVLKLLNLAALVVRCALPQYTQEASPRPPLLDATLVVGLLDTCLHVSHRAKRASSLLRSAAADALGQIVLVVFHEVAPTLPQARATFLSQLSALTNPQQHSDATCVTSLTLINIALETMQQPPAAEITILQNDLCKHLLQLSTTQDLVILSLTLRVIFNLFQSIRNHLKIPLEIFLTSVHLRILDTTTATHATNITNEQREVALESLLEFCQEPALMQDLYLNYDCDVQCTNLFESICANLARVASPETTETTTTTTLTALNRLALEGILHVMDSIARRCRGTADSSTRPGFKSCDSAVSDDTESETSSGNLESSYDDLGDRWKAEETHKVLQERKKRKYLLSKVASEFNLRNPEWVRFAEDVELFTPPTSPEAVAKFLYMTPHLDKTQIGLYLSKGPAEQFPFHEQVRDAFVTMFNFKGMVFAEALRTFLSRFRLPGEAQCIDRLMEAFAKEMFEQQHQQAIADALELDESPDQDETLFRNADAVFTLAFSTIILNTDLHNPTIKDDRRMTLEQFLRNNRGINGGQDFSDEYLTELYDQIKTQEIQVRKEVLDLARRHLMNGDAGEIPAKHWAGILSKSTEMARPFFTPAEVARRNEFQAGIHERDMFVSISKSAIKCISSIFVRSSDDALVIKALKGFRQMAKICVYFELDETFNEILQILLGHGRDYIMSCIALEYAGYDSSQIMAAGPASSVEESSDEEPVAEGGELPVPLKLVTRTEHDHHHTDFIGSAAHRGLLSLDCGFSLIRTQPSRMREAWPTLIECLCALRDARALPDRVIFLDDFADSRGNLLPLSPFAKQSQKRLDDYYRSLSDRDETKGKGWFRLPSLFKKHDRLSPPSIGTEDETDGGDGSSERELSSFSQSLLAVTKRAKLEQVVLMRPKNLPMAKQTIRALLDAIDIYPYFDDPVFEQHAVYSLELALLALISNKDRVQELFPLFLSKFETVLHAAKVDDKHPELNANLPTPFLMERVVVTILRSCIHLYDVPEVRPALRKSLNLLMGLPPNFTRFVSDRIACGMAIFLSQKFSLLETANEWSFIGDLLDRLAYYGAGRGFVFDGIANAVESQLAPSSQQGDTRAVLSLTGSSVIAKLLVRFVFGNYQNDLSLTVPAMMCLENLYRHMVMLKRSERGQVDEGDDEAVELVPDKELWQNVAVAFYSVCRSTEANISRQGSDCFQRFIASTKIDSVPDEKWIGMLCLIVNKQPPLAVHETRLNTFSILGKVLLMTVAHLSRNKENWDDLTDVINQTAIVVGENLREGRRGTVSPLFESTLQTVTFISNHMVTSEFGGDGDFGHWASETLLSELEKVGAGGGSIKNVAATLKPRITTTSGVGDGDEHEAVMNGINH